MVSEEDQKALIDELFAKKEQAAVVLNADVTRNARMLLEASKWGVNRVRITGVFDAAQLQTQLGDNAAALLNGVRQVRIEVAASEDVLALFPRMETLVTREAETSADFQVLAVANIVAAAATNVLPLLTSIELHQRKFFTFTNESVQLFWMAVNTRSTITHAVWKCDDDNWEKFDASALPLLKYVERWETNCPFISAMDEKLLPPTLKEYHGHHLRQSGEQFPIQVTNAALLDLLVSRSKTLEVFVVEVDQTELLLANVSKGTKMEKLRTFVLPNGNSTLWQFAINNLLGPNNTVLETFECFINDYFLGKAGQDKQLVDLLALDPTVSKLQISHNSIDAATFCPSAAVSNLTVGAYMLPDECLYGGKLSNELEALALLGAQRPISAPVLELPLIKYTKLREFTYHNLGSARFSFDTIREIAKYLALFPPTLYSFGCNIYATPSKGDAMKAQRILLDALAKNRSLVTFTCEMPSRLTGWRARWRRVTGERTEEEGDDVQVERVKLRNALHQFLQTNRTLVELKMSLLIPVTAMTEPYLAANHTLEYLKFSVEFLPSEVKLACVQNRRARLQRLAAHAALTTLRAMNRTARGSAIRTSLNVLLPEVLQLAGLPSNPEWNRKAVKAADVLYRIGNSDDAFPPAANMAIGRDEVVARVLVAPRLRRWRKRRR